VTDALRDAVRAELDARDDRIAAENVKAFMRALMIFAAVFLLAGADYLVEWVTGVSPIRWMSGW
jgi:hypothetical protein